MGERFWRLPVVLNNTGMKRSSLYRAIGKGQFPRQVKIGDRGIAWVESEVEEWIKGRIRVSRAGEEGCK
jgi:prophage regulatory protein